jgi:hypothetical protein
MAASIVGHQVSMVVARRWISGARAAAALA